MNEDYLYLRGIDLRNYQFEFPLEMSFEDMERLITTIVESNKLQATEIYKKVLKCLNLRDEEILNELCSAEGFYKFITMILSQDDENVNLQEINKILSKHSKYWGAYGTFIPSK